MARLRQFFGTALQNRLQLIWEKIVLNLFFFAINHVLCVKTFVIL